MNKSNNTNIPNPAQKMAIEHPPAPLMIIAGAGTGKTFTLENRIIYLIKYYKIDPSEILAITYTEKAAKELKMRIIHQVGKKAQNMYVGTFHSFCYKIVNDQNLDSNSNLIDESEMTHLLLDRYDDLGPFHSDIFSLDPKKSISDSFIPFFNRIRDELIDIDNIDLKQIDNLYDGEQELINQLKDLIRIYPIVQKWKDQFNLIDYNDMIKSAYNHLTNNDSFLKDIQNQYKHIIIDEFQDNNFALNEISRLISGKRQSITVVGDDDQVIYSFRGANSYNINTFKNTYGENSQFKTITLESNYRSTQEILNLANESIKINKERMEKVLISNNKSSGIKPIRLWASKPEQIKFIIKEIFLLKNEYDLKDIAILCRTHAQTKQIIEELDKYGLPNQTQKKGMFYISIIKDIVSWLQVIGKGNLQDIALYRLINKLCGPKVAHKVFTKYDSHTDNSILYSLRKDSSQKNKKIKEILSLTSYFENLISKKNAGEITWELCEKLDILKTRTKRYSLDDHFHILNIGDFLYRAQKFSESKINKKGSNNLISFNIYIESIMKSGGLPSLYPNASKSDKIDSITVNTVHGVKGSEYKVVFLPFQQTASFPLNFKSESKINKPPDEWLNYMNHTDLDNKEHHYQEEKRLFYVAITRAKELLYILAPAKRTSRFVKELNNKLTSDKYEDNINLDMQSYSKLKIKYVKFLQNAILNEDYLLVKELSEILVNIDKIEKGENIILGKTKLELELENDLKNDFIPEVPEQIKLSASSIDTYLACPLKYRLSKIDKIPQSASKPELVFGNIMHKVLQRFHNNTPLSKDRILKIYDEEWLPGKFDYKVREEKFFSQGKDMLIRYYEHCKTDTPNVYKTEFKFNFQIKNIIIVGSIDRIDKNNNEINIIDYKTSKTATRAKASLQLAIYSLYLEQAEDKGIKGIPSQSSLYFLREPEEPIRSHSFSFEELRNTEQKIFQVAQDIEDKKFSPIKGMHCNWCDYKDIACPIWEE